MKTTSALLCAVLLVTPAASAKTVSVEVPWEKARTIIAEGDFRPKIRVELQSSERLKGKLAGTTDAGLRLKSRGTETSIAREEVRTIRLVPRKATGYKYRLLGWMGGIAAGVLLGLLPGGGYVNGLFAFPVAYWFNVLGWRADRGTVLIVLDESAPDSSRDGSQAERPSSATEP